MYSILAPLPLYFFIPHSVLKNYPYCWNTYSSLILTVATFYSIISIYHNFTYIQKPKSLLLSWITKSYAQGPHTH